MSHSDDMKSTVSTGLMLMLAAFTVACTASSSGTGAIAGSGGGNVPGTGGGAPSSGSGGAGAGTGTGGAASGSGGRIGGGTGGRVGGSGGVTGTGTGGSSTGTVGATGATDGGVTAGCNAATWPTGGPASPQTIDVTVNGTTTSRQFYFALPASYVSSRAYRLIFAWHYAGGMASMIAANSGGGVGRYYGLQPMLPDSFYVAAQGLVDPTSATTGWPNTNGQDIAFTRALVDWMKTNFCIDQTRILSTGFSYGAIMSHTVGCQMSDVFRAIAPMSGALFGGGRACTTRPIAAWMTHGTADDMVAFTAGESARDRLVTLNHCATTTQAVTPSPCVSYDGCDAGYPVVWCPVQDGLHAIPSFAAGAIATFFGQF